MCNNVLWIHSFFTILSIHFCLAHSSTPNMLVGMKREYILYGGMACLYCIYDFLLILCCSIRSLLCVMVLQLLLLCWCYRSLLFKPAAVHHLHPYAQSVHCCSLKFKLRTPNRATEFAFYLVWIFFVLNTFVLCHSLCCTDTLKKKLFCVCVSLSLRLSTYLHASESINVLSSVWYVYFGALLNSH